MSDLPDFHSLHAAIPQSNAEPLTWHDTTQRFARVRIIQHTCDCQPKVYELCTSAGLTWIRATERSPTKPTIQETHPCSTNLAHELWQKVLTGRAT